MIGLIHFHKRWNLIFNNKKYIVQQASKWINAAIQSKECSVQERWILLEEEEGWENYQGRSHEAESTRFRGNKKPIDNYINSVLITVKPVYKGHPDILAFMGKQLLYTGSDSIETIQLGHSAKVFIHRLAFMC